LSMCHRVKIATHALVDAGATNLHTRRKKEQTSLTKGGQQNLKKCKHFGGDETHTHTRMGTRACAGHPQTRLVWRVIAYARNKKHPASAEGSLR
jgi:hypothetical protein